MNRCRKITPIVLTVICLLLVSFNKANAQQAAAAATASSKKDREGATAEALNSAIRRSIGLLEKASAGSAKKRKCFTCHNQTMPVLALVEARRHGFSIKQRAVSTV